MELHELIGYDQVDWASYFDCHVLPLEVSVAVIKTVKANSARSRPARKQSPQDWSSHRIRSVRWRGLA